MAKFCKYCGNPIDEGAVFCDNCGKPIEQEAPQNNRPTQYKQGEVNTAAGKKRGEKSKGLTGLNVILVIALLAVIIISLSKELFTSPKEKSTEKANVAEQVATTETQVETTTEPMTETPTEFVGEPLTEPPTEAPTEKVTKKKSKKSKDINKVKKPKPSDFAWIIDVTNGNIPSNAKSLGKKDFIGKWKAEFIFDGVWELVYITIDKKGTIKVQPYQINYGDGWQDESGESSYKFKGKFDVGGIYGTGKYGSITIYSFFKSNGVEYYGTGTLNAKSGATATVGLMRP